MDATGVTLRLPICSETPRVARHAVVDGLELQGDLAHSAALLISEAVSNSVLHTTLDETESVHVDAWWSGTSVHIEVCDEGGGLRHPSPARSRGGGHGLNLISQLADRWGVHSDGHTRIWFELTG